MIRAFQFEGVSTGVGTLRSVTKRETALCDKGMGDTGEGGNKYTVANTIDTHSVIPINDVVKGIRLKLGEVVLELFWVLVDKIDDAVIEEEKVAIACKKISISTSITSIRNSCEWVRANIVLVVL